MKIVISQPMFFPWVGLFEQIRLSDKYVHYSDVQFSKGSFVNRVQVKTAQGIKWLTVPVAGLRLGQNICDVSINNEKDWRHQHLELLRQAYAQAPHVEQMLAIVDEVYAPDHDSIGDLSAASIAAVCEYFNLDHGREFIDMRKLGIGGSGSRRVLDTVLALGGDRYITGLGARNYLEHEWFDDAGVAVEYMNYQRSPYAQLHGDFTPYVSILDLIANTGKDGLRYIDSGTMHWKEYVQNV